jgi:hypothetical protein
MAVPGYYGFALSTGAEIVDHKWDIPVGGEDVLAQVGLTNLLSDGDSDGSLWRIGILQCDSANGREDFSSALRQVIYRKGVTRIQIYMACLHGFGRGWLTLFYV